MRIAVFYNLKSHYTRSESAPLDFLDEFDEPDTIADILGAISTLGHVALDIQDPTLLTDVRRRSEIDMVFSICEMEGFRFREAIVPSLCELLRMPYVFAPPDAMVVALDKNLSNFVTRQAGVSVPDWNYVCDADDLASLQPKFWPLIVKLSAEGSSIGYDPKESLVWDKPSLCSWGERMLLRYKQPLVIQDYIKGREFTVAVLQRNGQPWVLEPIETKLHGRVAEPLCSNTRRKLQDFAEVSFRTIGCRDAARMDFMLSESGEPFFLECNTLPYLGARNGYLAQSAVRSGLGYTKLIGSILDSATSRYPSLTTTPAP